MPSPGQFFHSFRGGAGRRGRVIPEFKTPWSPPLSKIVQRGMLFSNLLQEVDALLVKCPLLMRPNSFALPTRSSSTCPAIQFPDLEISW